MVLKNLIKDQKRHSIPDLNKYLFAHLLVTIIKQKRNTKNGF